MAWKKSLERAALRRREEYPRRVFKALARLRREEGALGPARNASAHLLAYRKCPPEKREEMLRAAEHALLTAKE